MVGGRHVVGFARLGHEVHDENDVGTRAGDLLGDPAHQEHGDEAGIEAAGPDHHQVCPRDRPLRLGDGGGIVGHEPNAPIRPRGGDGTRPTRCRRQLSQQAHVRAGGGSTRPDREDLAGPLHRRGNFFQAAERRKNEVAWL